MRVCYTSIDSNLPETDFNRLKQGLPKKITQRNSRFIHYADRQRNLFGLLLLKSLWHQQFQEAINLQQLETTEFGRPYMAQSTVDFNISHAGHYIICALATDAQVGIDIEKKRPVEFNDFTRTMNQSQWNEITSSAEPEATFFHYWCIKESVIKLDGRGLSLPLTEIQISDQKVTYTDREWYIKPFSLDHHHYGCLASDQPIPDFNLTEVNWRDFLV